MHGQVTNDNSETDLLKRIRRLEQHVLNGRTPREVSGLNDIHAHEGETISPAALKGLTPRSSGITHLGGNLYVQSTQPEDAEDGDVWIDTSQ